MARSCELKEANGMARVNSTGWAILFRIVGMLPAIKQDQHGEVYGPVGG